MITWNFLIRYILGNQCCGIKLKILCKDSKLTKDFKEELFNKRQEREFIKINKVEDNILEVYIHNITKINVENRLRFYIEIALSLNLDFWIIIIFKNTADNA